MKTAFWGMLAAAGALALSPANPATAQSTSQDQLSDPGSAFVGSGRRAAWHAEVERTERGFRIGNPDAEASLIEFISYTCGHCATFAQSFAGCAYDRFLSGDS